MEQIISKNQNQTEQLGQKLAQKYLNTGEIILLFGGLGAGKTSFVRGFVKGLGISKTVSSPTFVLHKIYDRVHHFDLYRVEDPGQFAMLGFDELAANYPNSIFLIEWPENAGIEFKNSVKITFTKGKENNERIITIG